MEGLRLALVDLFIFVFYEYLGFKVQRQVSQVPLLSGRVQQLSLASPERSVLIPDRFLSHSGSLTRLTGHYVAAFRTPVFLWPTRGFDTVVGLLDYGEPVEILDSVNQWYHIKHHHLDGYVLREDIVSITNELEFLPGCYYGAEDSQTQNLRVLIRDEFFGEFTKSPLMDVEYVYYRLRLSGRLINWPVKTGRSAGSLKVILRGLSDIHIGITPKKGTVMETFDESGTGHLAYVNSVGDDEGINISLFGLYREGEFSSLSLDKSEWIEWRPVFIDVR